MSGYLIGRISGRRGDSCLDAGDDLFRRREDIPATDRGQFVDDLFPRVCERLRAQLGQLRCTAGDWHAAREMQKGFSHDRGGPYNAPGSPKDIGNVTAGNFTIPDDQGGAWFFALTPYHTEIPSLESWPPSSEVSGLFGHVGPVLAVGRTLRGFIRVSTWSWLPPALWTCPRCRAIYLVRELGARCRLCGYHEDGSFVAPSRL
jgi:hypothetical protein